MTNAWHLRNDGTPFSVEVHLYPMQDLNLASEAEVAAFIINTQSKDTDLAEYVLDAFMVLQLGDVSTSEISTPEMLEATLTNKLDHLPFHFAYPLTTQQMIDIHHRQNNFSDLDSMIDFMNEVEDNRDVIQKNIKDSFNQQFIRVRFGGQYDTQKGNNCIWFRVASVGYNWDNVIYAFTADMQRKLGIRYITICRDAESDGTTEDKFYKAKDGTVYYFLPVDEFFSEEHERNPVFSTTHIEAGVIQTIRRELQKGNTILGAYELLEKAGINCTTDYRPYLYRTEIDRSWINASEWFDQLKTRTRMKISNMMHQITQKFPEITDMDIDYNTRENRNGNPTGFELLCRLASDNPQINGVIINIASTKPLDSSPISALVRMFTVEYKDFLAYRKITV